jgi:hypothetical protein
MPRNPGAKKNQHNHKHENGLVGPGKRITKQRSNGQINGSPRGAHPDTPPLTPVTSNSLLNVQPDPDANDSQSDAKQDGPSDPRKNALRTRDSESSYDGQDFGANGGLRQKHSEDETLRRHEQTSTKSKPSHDVTSFQLASTILKSCTAYDTIALLILLLQLPTIFLILVEALFASLTFMPPAGITFGSMFSLFDVFQGSAGAPSLGTMIFVDAICFGLWFCLWTWAQNFALDLAQVQVAITLGGGGPEKSGGVNGICLVLVLLLHMVRSKGVRRFFFSYFFPPRIMSNQRVAQFTQFLPRESEFGNGPSPPSLVHSLLAVHIITQALMVFVRRRVASSQVTSSGKGTKRTDPEAAAGSQPVSDAPTVETGVTNSSVAGSDIQPSPTPGLKDLKDKSVSAKKRRRQANQIRSRQPFWAALASTKVTVMREYEHSRGSTKAAGRHVDEGAESNAGDEVVWITHVDPSTIEFEASNLFQAEDDQGGDMAMCDKPFYVRINGARWHSFHASCSKDDASKTDGTGRWIGEILGLAPNCTYTCTFVRAEDDEEFSCITVKTPALTDRDYPGSLAAPPLRQTLGPSSPTTTIKNSIQNAEAKLNEARNRLTKSRRTHKAALSKVEKEVESYNTRLKSSSDDNKQRQKLLQAQNNIRQNEDATVSIATALDNLAVIPEEEVADHSSRKDAFHRQRELLDAAIASKESARLEGESEISGVTSELNTIIARRERLTTRQTRLAEQFDRITQANTQGMNEKERKAAESMAKEADQARFEEHYHTQFNLINNEIQSLQRRTSQAWHEIHAFEQQASAQEKIVKNGGQLTPEGNLPGTNTSQQLNSRSFGFGFPNASMQPPTTMSPELVNGSPFLAYAKTLPPDNYRRPRSASNRSGGAVSNFSADFEDADPIPPMPAGNDFEVNALTGRKDSGSSRGHNNGSPGAMAMAMSGLGSPMKGRGSPGHGIW